MKNLRFALAALVGVAGLRAASATTWSGYSTMLPGTTVAERPELAGEVIASQNIVLRAEDGHGAFPGAILHNYVVREANAGTLDFYFQLTSTSAATQNILQMDITGFDVGPTLDVDQINPGTSYAQFFGARLASGQGVICTGSPARGSGTFALDAEESTAPLFVHTNATLFDASGTFSFEGEMVPTGTYAPLLGGGAAPVPEPTSLVLLPIALGGVMLRRVRRV